MYACGSKTLTLFWISKAKTPYFFSLADMFRMPHAPLAPFTFLFATLFSIYSLWFSGFALFIFEECKHIAVYWAALLPKLYYTQWIRFLSSENPVLLIRHNRFYGMNLSSLIYCQIIVEFHWSHKLMEFFGNFVSQINSIHFNRPFLSSN